MIIVSPVSQNRGQKKRHSQLQFAAANSAIMSAFAQSIIDFAAIGKTVLTVEQTIPMPKKYFLWQSGN
jgi:hypothetical protein